MKTGVICRSKHQTDVWNLRCPDRLNLRAPLCEGPARTPLPGSSPAQSSHCREQSGLGQHTCRLSSLAGVRTRKHFDRNFIRSFSLCFYR